MNRCQSPSKFRDEVRVFHRCFPGVLTRYLRSIHEKTLAALKDAAKSVSRLHSEFYLEGGILCAKKIEGASPCSSTEPQL
jgi:hypothetical protein